MGVVRVWNFKRAEEGAEILAAAPDWRKASRDKVDAVINRIRTERKPEIMNEETSCPECGYIIAGAFFPALCIYCGSAL
jgi:hypothetical protein